MAADTLPAFPVYELKDAVPAERFNVIASTVGRKLGSLLQSATKSSKGLQVQPILGFLTSYLRDVARHKLTQISAESGSLRVEIFSDSERAIRKSTLHLVCSLASHRHALPAALLIDLAVAYSPQNSNTLRTIFHDVLSDSTRATDFTSTVVPAFSSALIPKHPDMIELREAAHTLLCVMSCGEEVVNLFAKESSFIKALVGCYQTILPQLATSLGGIHPTGPRPSFEAAWLETKCDILDSYIILLHSLTSRSPERALEIVFEVIEVPHKQLSSESPTPFLNMRMSDDLNRVEDLVAMFKGSIPADDARLQVLATQLSPITSKSDIGILSFLPPAKLPSIPTPVSTPVPLTDKGKGKQNTNV